MSCKQDKILLNGSAEFTEYNKDNNVVNCWDKQNEIYDAGKNTYSAILNNMMKIDYPVNETYSVLQQSSMLSNYIQFGSQSGQICFLTPCNIKKNYITKNSVYQGKPYAGYYNENSSAMVQLNNLSERIFNGNACFDNRDANITVFKNFIKGNDITSNSDFYYYNFQDLKRFYYVYNIGANIDNNDKYTGIRVDFGGIPTKKNYFRIAFNYANNDYFKSSSNSGNSTSTILQQSKIRTTFPLLNGKPIYKQYGVFYGGKFTDYQTNSYFFDMYPRYFKIPNQIIFIFDAGAVNDNNNNNTSRLNVQKNDVTINNIQFFTHKQPKHSALGIYLKGTDERGNIVYFFKKIMKVFTKEIQSKHYLCYYTKIDYDQANYMNEVQYCGLCNNKNIFQYQPQYQLNKLYSFMQQNYDSYKDNQEYQYFFRKTYKQFDNVVNIANDSSNSSNSSSSIDYDILTSLQLDTPWVKSSNKRLDILYKIQVKF